MGVSTVRSRRERDASPAAQPIRFPQIDAVAGWDAKDVICSGQAKALVDFRSTSAQKSVTHAYVFETKEATEVLGELVGDKQPLAPSTLPVIQLLYGNGPERGHDQAYSGTTNPVREFVRQAKYLESLADDLDDYPDALSVLIGRCEGKVEFKRVADNFWKSFIAADDDLDTDVGAATRAYALNVLKSYQDFARDGPSRGLTDAIKNTVRNAGLPKSDAQTIKNYFTDAMYPAL